MKLFRGKFWFKTQFTRKIDETFLLDFVGFHYLQGKDLYKQRPQPHPHLLWTKEKAEWGEKFFGYNNSKDRHCPFMLQ